LVANKEVILEASLQLSEGFWNEGAAKNDISLTTVPDLIREGDVICNDEVMICHVK
jgi:hypothetical protein